MQEIAINSQRSGSEFQTTTPVHFDQWQVGAHGELIQGDDESMKTSEIESSVQSSSSEIQQPQ
jgi:hypothetical protein